MSPAVHPALEILKIAGAMDESHYLNLVVDHAVHQAVSKYENFPIAGFAELRDNPTALR